MLLSEERAQVVEFSRRLGPSGLSIGTGGNLSVRVGDNVVISPASVSYDDLSPELVCVLDLAGNAVEGPLAPSNELGMHLRVYEQTEHTAIVHAHSTFVTAVSAVVKELPPVHYSAARLGGAIRVSDYVTYGRPEGAAVVAEALEGRLAVIMQNHGSTTVGSSLGEAFDRAILLEWLAKVFYLAQSLGSPKSLSPEEVEAVQEKTRASGAHARALYEAFVEASTQDVR